MLCSVRMPARNVYAFLSGGTVFCGYSEKLTILRNSNMSYYCLQHHLMNTAQLLTPVHTLQPPIDQLQSTNLSAPDVPF